MCSSDLLVAPVGERIRLGLGVSVPFGLKTEYDADWVGRYQGIKSELRTINVNPTISYALSDGLAVAVGVAVYGIDSAEAFATVVAPFVEAPIMIAFVTAAWFLQRRFFTPAEGAHRLPPHLVQPTPSAHDRNRAASLTVSR